MQAGTDANNFQGFGWGRIENMYCCTPLCTEKLLHTTVQNEEQAACPVDFMMHMAASAQSPPCYKPA